MMFDDPGKYLKATGFFKEFIFVLSPNKLNPRYENVSSFFRTQINLWEKFSFNKMVFSKSKVFVKDFVVTFL